LHLESKGFKPGEPFVDSGVETRRFQALQPHLGRVPRVELHLVRGELERMPKLLISPPVLDHRPRSPDQGPSGILIVRVPGVIHLALHAPTGKRGRGRFVTAVGSCGGRLSSSSSSGVGLFFLLFCVSVAMVACRALRCSSSRSSWSSSSLEEAPMWSKREQSIRSYSSLTSTTPPKPPVPGAVFLFFLSPPCFTREPRRRRRCGPGGAVLRAAGGAPVLRTSVLRPERPPVPVRRWEEGEPASAQESDTGGDFTLFF
jgi:hypothetical protein